MIQISLALLLSSQVSVTFDSLIGEMTQLQKLVEYPDPPFVVTQSSSYDRASVAPGSDTWFANKDWGNYLRTEDHNGRKEFVLADVEGPGAMVRYWSPNPAGITRIYIDGSDTPAIEAKTVELLSGKVAPFLAPVAQETSKGWSLYAPIPYQKSLKVTIDNSDSNAERMYYQVQTRKYRSDVTIEPFSIKALESSKFVRMLKSIPASSFVPSQDIHEIQIAPGGEDTIHFDGSGIVPELVFKFELPGELSSWKDPRQLHNVLRNLRLQGTFDDELCIDAPLGDFLGCQVGYWPVSTLPMTVNENGTAIFRFPIAFQTSGHLKISNSGAIPVRFQLVASQKPYRWTQNSMHLKAQWTCFRGMTRPMVDLNFFDAKGQGVFVGCNISISNPTPDWWGEGDEKIYRDGEIFPSTFGTGTEDYFGYGWSNPALFMHPYHYQSHCDGPGTKGQSAIGRWQIIDKLPFETSMKFDMELWHWANVDMQYGRTAFWYAKPGGSAPKSDSGSRFLLPFIESGIRKVKGAAEGESMTLGSKSGGITEIQDFADLSCGKQIWWRDAKPGDTLVLNIPMDRPGRFHVFGRFCYAGDYGIHELTLGDIHQKVDFFGKLSWKTIELGILHVDKAGLLPFEIKVAGSNPKSEKRYMFGCDYLLISPED